MINSSLVERREVISANALLTIANAFYEFQQEENNIAARVLHLTGLEPTLWQSESSSIIELINNLSESGFEVEMTTNGSALRKLSSQLKTSGLKKCRISFPNFDRYIFQSITGQDVIENVKEGIEHVLKEGIDIKINRLILRDRISDIPEFLNYISARNLTVKFLGLHPFSKQFAAYYLPVEEIIEKYVIPITKEEVSFKDERSFQKVVYYNLKNGGKVEIRNGVGDFLNTFSYCISCEHYHLCEQSDTLTRPAVTLTFDNKIMFCALRKAPYIDLDDHIHKKASLVEIKAYIRYKVKEEIFNGKMPNVFMPIRAIITSQCNYHCLWCHGDGIKINAE